MARLWRRRVALRYRILDQPDGKLKRQAQPVPYMGGVIIYFAFISPISLMFAFNQQLLGILFASSILLLVGLFDDLKALTPGIKFLFQVVATYILLKSGIVIDLVLFPKWLDLALSFFWILTAINAFNIIDIMDGLAASVGALSALAIFVVSLYSHDFLISILALSLAAALLAFLKFNWEPARIYLGDAGSMVLGLILGSLAMMVSYTRFNRLAFLSGLFVLGIPLFDLAYVIILRLLKGKMPFLGSPDHFALRLRKKMNWSAHKTVSAIVFLQLGLCGLVVANFFSTPALHPGQRRAGRLPVHRPGRGPGRRQDGMNVIIGAGISGLSAGQALGDDFVVLEKSAVAGGLSGQYRAGGFAFDHGGHYFHFQGKPGIKEHVEGFHAFREYRRDSKVFLLERFIPYSLQYHLAYLPARLRQAILAEILAGGGGRAATTWKVSCWPISASDWYELFFEPFMGKFYGRPLSRAAGRDGQGEHPRPEARRRCWRGARERQRGAEGYNPVFYYPVGSLRSSSRTTAARWPAGCASTKGSCASSRGRSE